MFAINGLTGLGYLVFSVVFGISDWNGRGVMAAVTDPVLARVALTAVGIPGYYAVVRFPRKCCRMLNSADVAAQPRRSTIRASIGVALGGNAGLLRIGRFVAPTAAAWATTFSPSWLLRMAVVLGPTVFVAILGPGIAL